MKRNRKLCRQMNFTAHPWRIMIAWMSLGILSIHAEMVQIRAKLDDPTKADRPGFQADLLDTKSDTFLVTGSVVIPDDLGKIEGAELHIVDNAGKLVATADLNQPKLIGRLLSYDFSMRRDLVQNSIIIVATEKADSVNQFTFILGSFAIRDYALLKANAVIRNPPLALAEFGVAKNNVEGEQEFAPADTVPFVPGQSYGIRFCFQGNGRSIPVRVELELPTPPKNWGDLTTRDDRITVSADGRISSQTTPIATGQLIERSWVVDEDDPAGKYIIRLYANDQLIKTFNFEVKAP